VKDSRNLYVTVTKLTKNYFKLVVGNVTKQVKHGDRATFKYDDLPLKMSHSGCTLMRHFQPRVDHI